MINNISGLSSKEVEERIKKNLINGEPEEAGRSISDIIKTNTLTFFNGLNLVLAILVIIAGSPKNMLFAGVILTNTLTGIYQELKARKVLKKLSLVNKHLVKVLRDGEKIKIPLKDIVLDDVLVLEPGDEVVADGFLVSDESIEVDISSLTGEADPEIHKKGDYIYSGSLIFSGSGYLKADKIGKDTYISKLSSKVKEFKIVNSELKSSVDKIIRFLVRIIIPLGLMLIVSQMVFANKPWREALLSTIAGIISMIPEGLILLTTLSFFMGVIRLAKWNTLVQELPATEVLARVDTLCLDKTGTITKGSIVLSDVLELPSNKSDINFELSIIASAFDIANPTQTAVINYVNKNIDMSIYDSEYSIVDTIPFNSERKYSAVVLSNGLKIYLGAPEILLNEEYEKIKSICDKYNSLGKRVLLLGNSKDRINALLIFEDEIRASANSTIDYFESQGVDIKIISGDNPITVSNIAKKAGVDNAENYIDANNLPDDKEELKKILLNTSVFGRVKPEQKKDIVEALQEMGRTVAMTGDGVNDILALKKADCAIALANGNEATKSIAHLVLLDEDFSNLTHVVDEGRRIINNLEKNACLYLSKTIYSILFSLFFALTLNPYPFIPIQLTLIGGLTIGIPSFVLAFEANFEKVKKGFLKRVMASTLPKGLGIALILIITFMTMKFLNIDLNIIRTFSTLLLGFMGIMVLAIMSKPLNKLKSAIVLIVSLLFSLAFILPLGRRIFSFNYMPIRYILYAIALTFLSYFVMRLFEKLYLKFIELRISKRKKIKKR